MGINNKEGYFDKTAQLAIAHVAKQQKRRKKEIISGDKRQTKIKKNHKN